MRQLRAWWQRMRGLARGSSREQEMSDEIESHIQMQSEENQRAGMTPQEARRRAILKMGGVERTRQAYRERDTLPLIENLLQDLRFAFRQAALGQLLRRTGGIQRYLELRRPAVE